MDLLGDVMLGSKVITMPLPNGRDWLWYSDLDIVVLAPHLDAAGRERALDELQAEWRRDTRRHLYAVPTAAAERPAKERTCPGDTVPMSFV